MSNKSVPKEFLGAFKKGHRKPAREFIDEELSWKLLVAVRGGCGESLKALEWLTKFNNEYYKNAIKKGDPLALHASDELRLECSRNEYARKNDVYMNLSELVRPAGSEYVPRLFRTSTIEDENARQERIEINKRTISDRLKVG